MSVSLPSVDDFNDFWGDEADDTDPDRATLFIQLAADLLWLATGIENDPEDIRLALLLKYAILDMAVYLYVTRDSINETYGPYQSERIGSYSYTKSYDRTQRAVILNTATGVLFFDKVVQYLLDEALYADGLLSTENVFHRGYQPLLFAAGGLLRNITEADPNMDRRSLYGYFGNADDDEGVYQQ